MGGLVEFASGKQIWDPVPTHDSVEAARDRFAHRGYGYCLRCGFTWKTVKGHDTWYEFWETGRPVEANPAGDWEVIVGWGGPYIPPGGRRACFPLCEGCWTELGCGEARIEYYGALIEKWDRSDQRAGRECVSAQTRADIGRAVANGG